MLWMIAVLLALLWLFGMFTAYTLGGAIHLLLAAAVIAALACLLRGRKLMTW